MADNTTLPGTGDVIAADDIGGVKYQIVKPAFGALDTATLVTAGAGFPVAPQYTEQASLSAGSLNADLVASTDVSAYKSFALQFGGTWSGTCTFQVSNDNATWVSHSVYKETNLVWATSNTTNAAVFVGALPYRYLRVRMTSYSSGTATGTLELSASPMATGNVIDTVSNISNVVSVTGGLSAAADTVANGAIGSSSIAPPYMFNGGTWDRQRGNVDATILASAARTTTQTGSDITNYNGRGVKVVLDTTVASAGSVTLKIQGKDSVSGAYYDILTGAAVTGVSTNVYTVYPSLPAVTNVTAQDVLPRVWRVVVTVNNANTQTYSVGSCVLL